MPLQKPEITQLLLEIAWILNSLNYINFIIVMDTVEYMAYN